MQGKPDPGEWSPVAFASWTGPRFAGCERAFSFTFPAKLAGFDVHHMTKKIPLVVCFMGCASFALLSSVGRSHESKD